MCVGGGCLWGVGGGLWVGCVCVWGGGAWDVCAEGARGLRLGGRAGNGLRGARAARTGSNSHVLPRPGRRPSARPPSHRKPRPDCKRLDPARVRACGPSPGEVGGGCPGEPQLAVLIAGELGERIPGGGGGHSGGGCGRGEAVVCLDRRCYSLIFANRGGCFINTTPTVALCSRTHTHARTRTHTHTRTHL